MGDGKKCNWKKILNMLAKNSKHLKKLNFSYDSETMGVVNEWTIRETGKERRKNFKFLIEQVIN